MGPHRHAEPAYALMTRLAVRNGFPNAREFSESRGLRWNDVERGICVEPVAAIAGIDADSLRKCTFISNGSYGTLQKETLHASHWHIRRNICCNACLQDDKINDPDMARYGSLRRSWWDLTSVHKCPIHKCDLESIIRDSPRLQWKTSHERKYSSGWDAYILGRLGFVDPAPSDLLDKLTLDAAAKFVAICGGALCYGKKHTFQLHKFLQLERVVCAGFSIAKSEKSFVEFLDVLWRSAEYPKRGWPTTSIYGNLSQQLQPFNGEELAIVREVVIQHAKLNVPLGPKRKLFGQLADGDRTFSGLRALGDKYSRPEQAARLAVALASHADTTILNADTSKSGFSADLVGNIKVTLSQSVYRDKIMEELGISMQTFKRLQKVGIFVPIVDTKRHKLQRELFHRNSAKDLIDQLCEGVPIINFVNKGETRLSSTVKFRRGNVVKVLTALKTGKIRPIGRLAEAVGFDAVILRSVDVTGITSKTRPPNTITISEAAEVLKISVMTVRKLSEARLIASTKVNGGQPKARVWFIERAVQDFGRRYVLASKLIDFLNCKNIDVTRVMRSRFGVERSFAPEVIRIAFFERNALALAGFPAAVYLL